ncbi:MAG: threonine synthase [Cyclobacteriaceae bacterium]|nr:threonine synthase [Cyclobacteriaceae bacterium]
MNYYSTKNSSRSYSFKEALFEGLPSDNGLFVPENIPVFSKNERSHLRTLPLEDVGYRVMKQYIGSEIEDHKLQEITAEVLNFPIPLKQLDQNLYSLELFHGPTLAFKDVGGRFMSRSISYFSSSTTKKTLVLVATSGDTGSAVAHGFHGVENVDVVILYPDGMVSELQELQMTTLGDNITAIKIDGTFDDCQKLVKQGFLDKDLKEKYQLTSANSINIARFLPQSIYYFHALNQLEVTDNIIVSVPSGNFGNLTAGLYAREMGLPISKFIASTNINDIFPQYLNTGNFNPKPSISTLSNAMDVGNPSNFERIRYLFNDDLKKTRSLIQGFSYNDLQTKEAIKELYQNYQYLSDPHGAIGYAGLRDYKGDNYTGIFLETAHPSKFKDTVEEVINKPIQLPLQLQSCLNKESKSIKMTNNYNLFKEFILSQW